MSYAYPVYEDRVNKDVIRFYHCSEKKSDVRTHKSEYPPGSILDEQKEPIYVPEYSTVSKATPSHNLALAMLDCTIVNLYYMDGQWYMGTKNSWNIRRLHDFVSTTYGEFFEECLAMYPDFSYDKLDKSRMYTVLFSNPKCHLLSEQMGIYVYTEDDELANFFDVLPESDGDNYILLSEKEKTIWVCESASRSFCLSKLYSDRKRLYSSVYDFSVAKTFISALCKCKVNERNDFINYCQTNLNEDRLIMFEKVLFMFQTFELVRKRETKVKYTIPAHLMKNPNRPYSEKDIGFFVGFYKFLTN